MILWQIEDGGDKLERIKAALDFSTHENLIILGEKHSPRGISHVFYTLYNSMFRDCFEFSFDWYDNADQVFSIENNDLTLRVQGDKYIFRLDAGIEVKPGSYNISNTKPIGQLILNFLNENQEPAASA